MTRLHRLDQALRRLIDPVSRIVIGWCFHAARLHRAAQPAVCVRVRVQGSAPFARFNQSGKGFADVQKVFGEIQNDRR